MIDKYFYFVFDEDLRLLEVATCVDHPKVETREAKGKLFMVTFNLNILTKEQILEHIESLEAPRLTPKIREAMRNITNLFF